MVMRLKKHQVKKFQNVWIENSSKVNKSPDYKIQQAWTKQTDYHIKMAVEDVNDILELVWKIYKSKAEGKGNEDRL
jgi:hypothetical protein